MIWVSPLAKGATVCVGPSATGSGSGADWNNLKAWSSAPARGDTWYLVTGTYASKTFTTPVSGTTLITFKKATVGEHGGIATGWVDAMGIGQATFGQLSPQTSYLVFDGQTGGGNSTVPPDITPAHYGFSLGTGQSSPIWVGAMNGSYTDITIKHFYAKATAADVEKQFFQGAYQVSQIDNVTISHCLLDGWQGGFMTRGQSAETYDNLVWEYNICLNGYSSSANHGEWINANEQPISNPIIRHNIFKGTTGSSGQTGTIVGNNQTITGAKIYGNVFDSVQNGNGIITGTSVGDMRSASVFNNTLVNCFHSGGWVNGDGGTGNVCNNNLLYNMAGFVGGGVTIDFNAYFSVSSAPSESNKQTGTGNPFRNYAGMDYRLVANTVAGTALPSPYNVDPLGNARTSWTRGAYEFGTLITTPVISITPTSLSFGSVVTNTTSNMTFTVRNIGAGTLSGTVSVADPFTIVSGGTYNIGANQSQIVTVRFAPTSATSYSRNVTFTGGGGATATVSAAGILASANTPPTVSAISQNAADVDPNTAGMQVYEGTVVQYSGLASDANGNALTWQWVYTINGGTEVIYRSGAGAVTPVSFSYGAGAAGKTYLWKLRVSDGLAISESQSTMAVIPPPVIGGGLSFEAELGIVSAPFVSSGGSIAQSITTDLAGGGRAVYNFTVTNAGDYVIRALVNAPSLTGNSLYFSIDTEPQDPAMAWDILPPTSGFESRLVGWRGSGTADANEFVPKFFNLAKGTHQLIVRGREANTQLDSFAILKVPTAPQGLRVVASP